MGRPTFSTHLPKMMQLLTCTLVSLLILSGCSGIERNYNKLYDSQTIETEDLQVKFEPKLPFPLNGKLIRNGPSLFEHGKRRVNHVFDGFSKLISWQFNHSSDAATFTTKFLRTELYNATMKSDTIPPYLLFDAPIPAFGMFEKMRALMNGGDNYPVSVKRFGSGEHAQYVSLNDVWPTYTFDPTNLNTIHKLDLEVPGGANVMEKMALGSTSHPLPEAGTDNMISFVSINNPMNPSGNEVRVIRITADNRRELIQRIPVKNVPYMHSFGMTENYAVIFATPMYVDSNKILKTASPAQSIEFHPEEGLPIHVIHLKTGQMFSVKTKAYFTQHFVNGFEDGDFIYIDYITYDDMSFISSFSMDVLRDPIARNKLNMNCEIKRFVINKVNHTVEIHDFSTTPDFEMVNGIDMVALNPNNLYNKYCYTYGIVGKADGVHLSTAILGKKDVCQGGQDKIWQEENHFMFEPIFIPRPNGTKEDDGILLAVVLDGNEGVSYLGAWDASTMEQISKSYLPFPLPMQLHGEWFAE